MLRQIFGPIWLRLIEVLNLVGGEAVIDRRMQNSGRVNLAQPPLCPFESPTEIARFALIVLRTPRVGIEPQQSIVDLVPLPFGVLASGRFSAALTIQSSAISESLDFILRISDRYRE